MLEVVTVVTPTGTWKVSERWSLVTDTVAGLPLLSTRMVQETCVALTSGVMAWMCWGASGPQVCTSCDEDCEQEPPSLQASSITECGVRLLGTTTVVPVRSLPGSWSTLVPST